MSGDGRAGGVAFSSAAKALESWPKRGVPERPGAWLTRTARNLAVDRIRRARRFEEREDAIAAVHADAPSAEDTDWAQIAALYTLLVERAPTPVVRLNHAVAVAMAEDCECGLELIDALEGERALRGYHPLPAARADLQRRLTRREEARREYEEALKLVRNDVERRYLERRLASLDEA